VNTLVLRQVPDSLYKRLKTVAAAHRRSMNQEAILALEAGLPTKPARARPDADTTRRWLTEHVWNLPQQGDAVLDTRSTDAILGFDDRGLCD